jgi:hypothetical protein
MRLAVAHRLADQLHPIVDSFGVPLEQAISVSNPKSSSIQHGNILEIGGGENGNDILREPWYNVPMSSLQDPLPN